MLFLFCLFLLFRFFLLSCLLFVFCSSSSWILIFPESDWAKGSSNSGGLSNIFTSWHLLILTFSHLHIFSSSHPLIFTSSHPYILTSSHPHIFTSSHLHIFSSSDPYILTSSHPHIFTSSHLRIFSSSHLHILTSSHSLLPSSSSQLHIFSSSHLIFTSSHLHIFTSSHLHILSCPLALLPSCSLALLLSPSFLFLSWRRGAVPTRRHETQPFHTKRGSIAKNWGKRFLASGRNSFARNEVRSPKNWVKIAISWVRSLCVKVFACKRFCL